MSEKIYGLICASYEMLHMFDINGRGRRVGGGNCSATFIVIPLC